MPDKIETMSLNRIRDLIEAYGADPVKWSEQERALALAFLTTSPEAQRLVAEATALDATLDTLPEPALSPEVRTGILDAFTPAKPIAANENIGLVAAITRWHPQSNGSWLRAAAAAIVFGVLCGVGGTQIFTPPSTIVVAQPALPELDQPIPELPLQNGVAALNLNGELPAILADTGSQTEAPNDDAEEDSEIPLT